MNQEDDGLSQPQPHDLTAEQSVLGGMLLSERAVMEVIEALDGPEFYRPAHETIYRTIASMAVRGEPVDPITVSAELTKLGQLARVGGASYLHTLVQTVPTAANAEYYAGIVRDMAVRRRVLEAADRAAGLARAGDGDVDELLDTVRTEITAATEPAGPHSGADAGWEFADLSGVLDGSHKPLTPTVGARDDGVGLFYPGRINGIQGESEAGKSWAALIAALTEINRGNHVVYIDFEDSADGIVARLLLIGALPQDIRARFHYVRSDLTPSFADRLAFFRRVEQTAPALVVVDGVTEAMAMLGLELKDNTEIANFRRIFLRPLADTGAAVVPLDHVVKDGQNRGRYALGGVHKLNGVDGVQYTLEAVRPFGVNAEGRSRLRIAKDRPAQVRKHALPGGKSPMHWFADLVVKSGGDQFAEAHIYPPIQRPDDPEDMTDEEQKEAEAEAEIRDAENKILAALGKASEPLTTNGITDRVSGRASVVRRALARLVDSGRVTVAPGPRGSKLHSLSTRGESAT